MAFTTGFKFEVLLRTGNYVAAIAEMQRNAPALASRCVWAYYRLGCYASVIEAARRPSCSQEAMAIGVSLAACGFIEKGSQLLLDAADSGLLRGSALEAAAISIAQYNPDTALSLISKCARPNAILKASILLATNRPDMASALLDEAPPKNNIGLSAEKQLILANLSDDQALKNQFLNSFFSAHALAPVERANNNKPISASNIRTAIRPGSVRGPLVSVIVPAYNTETRIKAAIESLLAQTYRDIEIIVSDDCSSDNTRSIVSELSAADMRVNLIALKENSGPYAARNAALKICKGEFVTCHDSDDWAHPSKIEQQVIPLLKSKRLMFTTSQWVRLQDDGMFYARQVYPLTRLNPASPLMRRAVAIERLGFYESVRSGADSEYLARMRLEFGKGSGKRISKPLSLGAHRPGSLMTDAITGTGRGAPMNPERLDYWERWNHRHIRCVAECNPLYTPMDAAHELATAT